MTSVSHRREVVLLAVITALVVPGVYWGLPSAVTPQVDSPAPLGSLLFVAEYGKGTLNVVYPMFHQILLLPLYALVGAGFWLAGEVSRVSSTWPYGFRDPSRFFSLLILMTNLVSLVMGVVLLAVLRPLTAPRREWVWAGLLLVGTNGVFVYYSRVGNLDMPYTFWWGLSLWLLWRYFFGPDVSWRALVAAGVAAAAATASKDQASSFAIGAGLLVLLMSPSTSLPLQTRFRNVVVFTLALLVAYAVLAILPDPRHWWAHFRFVTGPHAPTDIPLSVAGEIELLGLFFRELWTAYGVPVLTLSLVGALWLLGSGRARMLWLLVVPPVAYYLIVIAKTRVLYPRFMLPFVVPIFILVTFGAAAVAERVGQRGRKVWVAGIALLVVYQMAFSYGPVTYAQVFDLKRQVTAELPRYVPPGEPLLISRMQSYNFPNRGVYERYRVMMLADDPIVPPSRHAASILKPLDPTVGYFLLGSGTAGLPWHQPQPYPPLVGEKVVEWRYPEWVRRHLIEPCLYEFTLYRRTGPLPDVSTPPARAPATAPSG